MQDGLLVVDVHGRIQAINPAFEAMTGYNSAELVNRPCTVLNCTGCEIFGQGPREQWCALFAKGAVRHRKCEIMAKDGRTVPVVKHATVLRDEKGEITGAVESLMDISEMVRQEREIDSLRCSLNRQGSSFGIVGSSLAVQRLLDLIENVASSDAPVLIHGESGVGKELVARAVHEAKTGAQSSFVKVNCAALNQNLLESELFGHVKGAFTGASKGRMGRFEAACGGSIFLDEIGDLSPDIQVKLLRVLESREIERVGDHRAIPIDARIITATNKNLEEAVRRGLFREDLFYRINVVPVRVPPLRERKEDIPLLAQTFIDRIASRTGKAIVGLSAEAIERMLDYDWPGNVRQLLNAIEHAFVLCHEGEITLRHLPASVSPARSCPWPDRPPDAAAQRLVSVAAYEKDKERLISVLKETGGNQTKAAEILGVSRVTVWKRMKKYGIRLERGPKEARQ
jgi:PAS domain S-box-containing protein